jgi:hypothetical protein
LSGGYGRPGGVATFAMRPAGNPARRRRSLLWRTEGFSFAEYEHAFDGAELQPASNKKIKMKPEIPIGSGPDRSARLKRIGCFIV